MHRAKSYLFCVWVLTEVSAGVTPLYCLPAPAYFLEPLVGNEPLMNTVCRDAKA